MGLKLKATEMREEMTWLAPRPYLRQPAPGHLWGPVAPDHDGAAHLLGSFGTRRLIEQVVVRLVAGVQATLPDLLVEPGVWGEGLRHLWA